MTVSWVPSSWDAVKTGDTVKLRPKNNNISPKVKGIVREALSPSYITILGLGYTQFQAADYDISIRHTPAPTTPPIPTESGFYLNSRKELWTLEPSGEWRNDYDDPETPAAVFNSAPFVKLEPRNETIDTFIAALMEKCPKEGNTYRVHSADLIEVAVSMGVNL